MCPPPVPSLRRVNPVHGPTFHFLNIRHNIILPSTPESYKWFLSFMFPTKTVHAPLLSSIRATCPGCIIILDLIARTIQGEEYFYISLSSSLCSSLHSPVPSSLLSPNIVFSILFSNTLSQRSFLNVSVHVSTHIK